MKTNVLRKWWGLATPEEKIKLAKLADTTYNTLNQAVISPRTEGKLQLAAEYARRLELAAAKIHRKGLPELRREDMCPACGKCEFAKQCRG